MLASDGLLGAIKRGLGFAIGLVLPVTGGLILIDHVVGIDPSATMMDPAFGWADLVAVGVLAIFVLFALKYAPGKAGRHR